MKATFSWPDNLDLPPIPFPCLPQAPTLRPTPTFTCGLPLPPSQNTPLFPFSPLSTVPHKKPTFMTAAHCSLLPSCSILSVLVAHGLPGQNLSPHSNPPHSCSSERSNRSHGNYLALQKLRCFGACENYFPLPSQNKPKETKMIRKKLENKQELSLGQLLDSFQQ